MWGTDRRTRAAITIAATLAWALAATPALAGSVYNDHGSNTVAQVVWGTANPDGSGHYGGLAGDVEAWGTVVSLFEDDSEVIACADGSTALAGTSTFGSGSGTVVVAPSLGSAEVTGTLDLMTQTYDGCTGTSEVVSTETGVPMTLELIATGPVEPWMSREHQLVAGVFNFHVNTHSLGRRATGTATLDGAPYAFDSGLISRNHWSSHENDH